MITKDKELYEIRPIWAKALWGELIWSVIGVVIKEKQKIWLSGKAIIFVVINVLMSAEQYNNGS